MPSKGGFYGVEVGRIPGVYTSWDKVKEQTDGFPKAKHKRFPTHDLAYAFAFPSSPAPSNAADQGLELLTSQLSQLSFSGSATSNQDTSTPGSPPSTFLPPDDWLVAYVNGGCTMSQGAGPLTRAGYGIYMPIGPLTAARSISGRCVEAQTPNRAQLMGVIKALESIPRGERPVTIHVNATYPVTCASSAHGWKLRGWKKSDGKPVQNLELVRYMYALICEHVCAGEKIRLVHMLDPYKDEGTRVAENLSQEGRTRDEDVTDWASLLSECTRRREARAEARGESLAETEAQVVTRDISSKDPPERHACEIYSSL